MYMQNSRLIFKGGRSTERAFMIFGLDTAVFYPFFVAFVSYFLGKRHAQLRKKHAGIRHLLIAEASDKQDII